MDIHEFDLAKDAYNKARSILNEHKKDNKKEYDMIKSYLRNTYNLILLYEEKYECALFYFTNELSMSKNKYCNLNIHFLLAGIYEKMRDKESQKQHLEFVSNEGNTLYIKKQADEILKTL